MKGKRVLTGDRPTGSLHLGHYFGSLRERVRMQENGADCYFIIADFQVLTDRMKTDNVYNSIFDILLDYLSVGIDPRKSTIFIQSCVPDLAELTVVFSMLVSMSRLGRNPTVKEEARAMGLESSMSIGMFSYPVSQASDILLFNADLVPVGDDQLPHLELTREIAKSFNHHFDEIFHIPDPVISSVSRLLGLDGSDKMSKSRNNAIFLSDTADDVRKKIKAAKTDSGHELHYDPERKPAISSLLQLYQIVTGKDLVGVESEFVGKGYGDFKKQLSEAVNVFLDPIRLRRKDFAKDRSQLVAILR